jgi:hypothetical protein
MELVGVSIPTHGSPSKYLPIGELTGLDPQRFSGQVELLTIARLSESAVM